MRPPLIQLQGLTRTYGRGDAAVSALRGIDLTLFSGDFLAVMGASGSGKSTLMNILGCLDTPSGGHYGFESIAVETLNQTQRALLRRHRLGFVFQGFNLLARTSARENVELPLLYRGLPAARRRQAALAALDLVGLSDRAGHTPAELSGGQQQRVAIARAIVTDPAVLLADEPTGNLDTARSHAIMELLTRLNRERGLTIIMVTHEEEMAAYAGRTLHLRDGLIDRDSAEPDATSCC
ncbi:ABC transporter ATP-binding protein [Novispirillum itersonii]|uniref:ABC transporter ATP-binding protein n=1 Tax=Novispirillum itersonii TaxID=189 RepID=UPI000365CA97|nr:ABC transporter ATP-binding protein [Novispirillum itersonii]